MPEVFVEPLPSPAAGTPPPVEAETSALYRFSVDQYERMTNLGVLAKSDRVELIDGLLVRKLTRNSRHLTTTWEIRQALVRCLPPEWFAVAEYPVVLDRSEPEPDVLVLRGRVRDYAERKPTPADVALVVEVADTSHRDDLRRAAMYAQAGILTYWIANIQAGRIEVYSNPGDDAYQTRADYLRDQRVPLIVEGREIATLLVDELLARV